MTTFAHGLGRLAAAFGLVMVFALTPASTEAGVGRGIHRGRGLHRHHGHPVVRHNVARRAIVHHRRAPRFVGVASAPILVQPYATNSYYDDDYADCWE